ncbi:hypothetical protein EOPP23_21070 [Endozoicomonas sp. OPT23]|uniref:SPOR domain-containing protein n=1 Tax=Endozoicomonas sp. OPT23 TaxID=2072845 RepID=UPI00129A82E4|nr:SPOR domain-containing protein [Endozoicomonas sp. OPT23]MRI35456.1 hypothetical protein [Endozoicomonas sp. OPT23]
MSGSELFKDKPLRIGVVASLTTLTVFSAEALLLPPKPLTLSSSWDCQAGPNSDWLCRKDQAEEYSQSLETVSVSRQQENLKPAFDLPEYQPERPAQPAYRSQPRAAQPTYYSQSDYATPAVHNQPRYNEKSYSQNGSREASYGRNNYAASNQPQPSENRMLQLLNAGHGSYVVQWLATNNQDSLKQLQNRFPVLRNAAIVPYRRANKTWFVLLDGPFQNREHAMSALNSPPRLFIADKLYPWTRSMASIQKLNLIMPGEIQQPGYDQPAVAQQNPYLRQQYIEQRQYAEPVNQSSDRLFASIAPAYPQVREPEPQNIDYNSDPFATVEQQYQDRDQSTYGSDRYRNRTSDQNYRYDSKQRSSSRVRDRARSDDRSRARYQAKRYRRDDNSDSGYSSRKSRFRNNDRTENYDSSILNAPDGSYTVQWLSGPRRMSLERAKRRYSYLADAEIIHYKKGKRSWYMLVSDTYLSKSEAVYALDNPKLSRMATSLSPRVRPVNQVRVMVRGRIEKQSVRKVTASSPLNNIIRGPSGTYTIQWFAANNPSAIQKMKQRFPELNSAVTAHYRKNNKDWYVLLQGQFTSSRDAIAAIKSPQLQDAVRVLHPWTRPVNSLKKLQVQDS